jgi:hypothetical protein
MLSSSKRLFLSLCACTAAACSSDAQADLDPPQAVQLQLQALREAELSFGDAVLAELTGRAQDAPSWTFQLSAAASVSLRTQAAEAGELVDTVMTLQRRNPRGWSRPFARSDDGPYTHFSELTRQLEAGDYRVAVDGFTRRARGPFLLASRCEGAGCPPRPAQCLFGGTFRELRDSALFDAPIHERLLLAQASTLNTTEAAQLLSAVRVAYEDANDLSAAFEAVDQNEVHRYTLREHSGPRTLVVYEYGAGDNSYGAAFELASTSRATEIHDGDLYECNVFGTPHGARAGAECGGWWGMTCDFGLGCTDFDPANGTGRCAP